MLKRWVLAQEEVLAREFDQHKFSLTEQSATPAAEWSRLAYVSQANLTNANDFYALPSVPVDQQGHELRFSLPFPVAHVENATAMAEYFPSKRPQRAVIILGHWNATRESYNELARYYQRFGISALRLTLPYHDQRRPLHMPIAHGLLSADLELTIQSMRQAVVEVRRCVHWLQERGHQEVGLVGSSMGSMVGLLALCHEPRLRAFVGYLSGADFPRVVWQGSATQHIVRALGSGMNQELLARVWACINPENYLSLLGQHRPRMHIGAARYDTICEAAVTKQMLASLRAQKIPHRVHWYGCGHNTLALFPFRQLAGLRGILFMRGL